MMMCRSCSPRWRKAMLRVARMRRVDEVHYGKDGRRPTAAGHTLGGTPSQYQSQSQTSRLWETGCASNPLKLFLRSAFLPTSKDAVSGTQIQLTQSFHASSPMVSRRTHTALEGWTDYETKHCFSTELITLPSCAHTHHHTHTHTHTPSHTHTHTHTHIHTHASQTGERR